MKESNTKKIRVAINGFGRIGRAFFKVAQNFPSIDIVAVNDLGDIHNMAYLLKYDTAYRHSGLDPVVSSDNLSFKIGENVTKYVSEKDPAKLPWKDLSFRRRLKIYQNQNIKVLWHSFRSMKQICQNLLLLQMHPALQTPQAL
jgi:hypothetical protein